MIPQLPDYGNINGSGETLRNKIAKEQALYNAGQKRTDYGSVKNLLLKQKMEALTWLARSSSFLTDGLAHEMVEAFSGTEVPMKDHERRRRYMNQITESESGLAVC